MAPALWLSVVVLGVCLEQAHAVKLPPKNAKNREDLDTFYEMWPLNEKMDGTTPNVSKWCDISLHDADLTLGGIEAWRDLVYPFQAEKEFYGPLWSMTFRRSWWLGYLVSTIYLIAIWMGTNYMKSRPAYHLKGLLALWNLFLAVFSMIGMVRVVPHLALMLFSYDFEYTICRTPGGSYGNGAAGLWILAFILSKYFELIDTVFLVLRKKPVNFLHWYHHCTVLMYCWHSYVFEMPTGIYFAAMNYSVHALMYLYYFLAAVLPKPPRWATWVTILQLAQMVGGIFITVSHLRILLYRTVPECDGHLTNLIGALAMYASYFVLFAQFFAQRYCRKGPKGRLNGKEKMQGVKHD